MGSEISQKRFKEKDFLRFTENLTKETALLEQGLKAGQFSDEGYSTGIELEAWLLDDKYRPNPKNKWFLKKLDHPQVVHELARYCIELNGSPVALQEANALKTARAELEDLWANCEDVAHKMDSHVLMAGTPPTLHDSMLTPKTMSDSKRFFALNEQLMSYMQNHPVEIHITGKENLRLTRGDIMLASSTAALHIQLKMPVSKTMRFFNATQAISAPMVAMTANSPFLFGRDLWLESRVPIFEHALNSAPTLKTHALRPRVFFGSGFLNNNLIEYFQTNAQQHPALLAADLDGAEDEFAHLNLHNGTIWRWNRLVLGKNEDDTRHFRIEHRCTSSGPTLLDSMANLAFFLGCTYALAHEPEPIEQQLSYPLIERNFYKGARRGVAAQVNWRRGQPMVIRDLIVNELLPKAEWGLRELGIDKAEVDFYLNDIIRCRVQTGQTGAHWQRSYIRRHGEDFAAMTAAYIENQREGLPVHNWSL